MKPGRPSATALKVATGLVALAAKPGWAERLPQGLPEMSERLLITSGARGYGPRSMALAKRPWWIGLYDAGERLAPGMFEGVGERKIFMNDQALAAIADGARQVLVLGAGLDTLCLRLAPAHPGVQFVEIDHPSTSAAKARGASGEDPPSNFTMIAADLAEESLAQVLSGCGAWRENATSFVVAEGLLMYLAPDDVRGLFAALTRATGAGSRVALSYLVRDAAPRWAGWTIRLIGEPWLSYGDPNDLGDYTGPGWETIAAPAPHRSGQIERFAVVKRSD